MNAVPTLRGRLIPAVPALFGEAGTFDRSANERYARWMADQDVGGIAVWAHTGRGLLLSPDDRAAVLQVWAEAIAGTIVCGVGVPSGVVLPSDAGARTAAVIAATVGMAGEAKAGGAHVVMVHPPTPLRSLPDVDERVLDLYRAVGEVGLPMLAFHLYEAAGGIAHPPDVVRRLLEVSGVVGIKVATLDSVVTYQDLASVVRAVPGTLLVTGEDRFLGYSLMLGADAALVGIGAACTDVTAALVASWFADDQAAFQHGSRRLDAFARVTFCQPMEGYVQRMIWALEADGAIAPGMRDPFSPPLGSGDWARVASAVRELRAS